MNYKIAVLSILITSSLSACTEHQDKKVDLEKAERLKLASAATEVKGQAKSSPKKEEAKKVVRLEGKVFDAKGLDGCKFLIEIEGGKKLQPINLDTKFQKDGIRIRFDAEPATGMMSICMAGEMVKVSEVTILETESGK